MTDYEPNKAYLLHGSWQGVWQQMNQRKDSVWVKLALTPGLFAHARESAEGIVRAKERGYLKMEARQGKGGNIRLSVLIDQNMGDEDGFGVEPDDYLEGIVALDGTFIEPLHIE